MERQRSKETGQQRNIKRRNIKTETDPEKKERQGEMEADLCKDREREIIQKKRIRITSVKFSSNMMAESESFCVSYSGSLLLRIGMNPAECRFKAGVTISRLV